MTEDAIDSDNISTPAPDTAKPKGARKLAKKAKSAKKAGRAKKPASKPKADSINNCELAKLEGAVGRLQAEKYALLGQVAFWRERAWKARLVAGTVLLLLVMTLVEVWMGR